MNIDKIKRQILNNIKDTQVLISSNDNKHFNAIIITDNFIDKSLLERQQLIYKTVNNYIVNGNIHALSFKTYTKSEWENEQNK